MDYKRDDSEPTGGAFMKNIPKLQWQEMYQRREAELPTLYRTGMKGGGAKQIEWCLNEERGMDARVRQRERERKLRPGEVQLQSVSADSLS
jgi:hypothetical protein